jgi:hypothetical protein
VLARRFDWLWSDAMNDHEIDRIAAAMHQLRPDWPVSSVRTLIAKHLADRPRRDVAVALAWIACETNTATPKRVLEAGPWWKAASADGATVTLTPYDPRSTCDICGKPEATCRRNELSGHEFTSAHEHSRRLAHDGAKKSLRELILTQEGDHA